MLKKLAKVFPSHRAHRAAPISVSLALRQTPAEAATCKSTYMWSACLATSLHQYQFIALGDNELQNN